MDTSQDIYVFSFALLDTLSAILVVYYTMEMFQRFERGEISARSCCKQLNDWVPIRVFIHILLVAVLIVFGHIYLFLLNLPMMIWIWKNILVGYDPNEIVKRDESVSTHLRICSLHMTILIGWLIIYTYDVVVLSGLKIVKMLGVEKVLIALLQLDLTALWRQ